MNRWQVVVVVLLVGTVTLVSGCAVTGRGSRSASQRPGPSATPTELPAGTKLLRDVSYGSDPDQKLDVYAPAGAQTAPVIVMVHGGGWRNGDKANPGVVENKSRHYLAEGYVFVSVNYRLDPSVSPTQQAGDVAAAVAYVQANAASWGADPARVVLMGHSAGANLVSLVAAAPAYLKNAGAAAPAALVSLDSAAYDVPRIMNAPHLSLYDEVFDHDEALWQAASPTLNVSGNPPPALLVCGSGRADSCPQADPFAAALTSHGGQAKVAPVALTHGQIDDQLGAPGALTDTVDAFLRGLGLPG